ncbi:MAG: DUF2653 family protein [Bacillus sp. (in: firmicutes)]
MTRVKLTEQDVTNAICMYMADLKRMKPEDIEVELLFDDESYGFSAEVHFSGRSQFIAHRDMVEAIRFWISHVMNGDPYAGIEFVLDDEEGIIAYING